MSKAKNNTILLEFKIDQDAGVLDVEVDFNFSKTMPEDQQNFYENVVNGIMSKSRTELDGFAKEGYYLREINELRSMLDAMEDDEDDDDFGISFEPAEELLETIAKKENGNKVINFKPKKVH